MNRLGIVNQTVYGKMRGSENIVDASTLNQLDEGAIAILKDDGFIYDHGSLDSSATTLNNVKSFTIHLGLKAADGSSEGTKVLGPIVRRQVFETNVQVSNTSSTPESVDVEVSSDVTNLAGDLTFTVKSLTYNNVIANGRKSVTLKKSEGETSAAFGVRLANALAGELTGAPAAVRSPKFFTVSPDADTFEMYATDSDIKLSISISGSLAEYVEAIINQPYLSLVTSKDLLAMERDFSATEGNGGYQELNDLWFSANSQTDVSKEYDIINILEQAQHTLPQNNVNTAVKRTVLGVVKEGTIGAYLNTAFGELIGGSFIKVGGAETGTEQGEVDQINQNPAD